MLNLIGSPAYTPITNFRFSFFKPNLFKKCLKDGDLFQIKMILKKEEFSYAQILMVRYINGKHR